MTRPPSDPTTTTPVPPSPPGSREDLLDRMTLLLVARGVPEQARRLVRTHGGVQAALRHVPPSPATCRRAAAELERSLATGAVVIPGAGAPVAASLPDPPLLLMGRGAFSTLAPGAPRVAIVGTRDPDLYGVRVARLFAAALVEAGVVVVSGGARGIDAEAHVGALDAGGRSVAVLASGLDHPSPVSSRPLMDRLAAAGGLVVTEVPPGLPARPHVFPDRNRLVAGLADVVLIVQAASRSGTLLTARHARTLGRPVLAVPGDVCYRTSAGSNGLLSRGEALAVTQPGEVLRALDRGQLRELRWPPMGRRPPELPPGWSGRTAASWTPPADPLAQAVVAALREGPLDLDALASRVGAPVGALLGALGALELAGAVRRTEAAAWGLRQAPDRPA